MYISEPHPSFHPRQATWISYLVESAFDTEELFLESFPVHVHHAPDEFVINFDEVWSWMGFSRKDVAKRLLEKTFQTE
jgi:glycine cleavage system protein P-like pyridoxal-binding family